MFILRGGLLSECAKGYIGPLCSSCQFGYSKVGLNKCIECSKNDFKFISFLGITLLILILLGGFLLSAK